MLSLVTLAQHCDMLRCVPPSWRRCSTDTSNANRQCASVSEGSSGTVLYHPRCVHILALPVIRTEPHKGRHARAFMTFVLQPVERTCQTMKSDARCVCGTVHRIQGRRRDTSVRTGSATSYRFERTMSMEHHDYRLSRPGLEHADFQAKIEPEASNLPALPRSPADSRDAAGSDPARDHAASGVNWCGSPTHRVGSAPRAFPAVQPGQRPAWSARHARNLQCLAQCHRDRKSVV